MKKLSEFYIDGMEAYPTNIDDIFAAVVLAGVEDIRVNKKDIKAINQYLMAQAYTEEVHRRKILNEKPNSFLGVNLYE